MRVRKLNSQNQAGETNGSIPVEVPKTMLDQAAKDAKSAGVNVVQDTDVNKGTVKQLKKQSKRQKLRKFYKTG